MYERREVPCSILHFVVNVTLLEGFTRFYRHVPDFTQATCHWCCNTCHDRCGGMFSLQNILTNVEMMGHFTGVGTVVVLFVV
jgi:hypothetical protein